MNLIQLSTGLFLNLDAALFIEEIPDFPSYGSSSKVGRANNLYVPRAVLVYGYGEDPFILDGEDAALVKAYLDQERDKS